MNGDLVWRTPTPWWWGGQSQLLAKWTGPITPLTRLLTISTLGWISPEKPLFGSWRGKWPDWEKFWVEIAIDPLTCFPPPLTNTLTQGLNFWGGFAQRCIGALAQIGFVVASFPNIGRWKSTQKRSMKISIPYIWDIFEMAQIFEKDGVRKMARRPWPIDLSAWDQVQLLCLLHLCYCMVTVLCDLRFYCCVFWIIQNIHCCHCIVWSLWPIDPSAWDQFCFRAVSTLSSALYSLQFFLYGPDVVLINYIYGSTTVSSASYSFQFFFYEPDVFLIKLHLWSIISFQPSFERTVDYSVQ